MSSTTVRLASTIAIFVGQCVIHAIDRFIVWQHDLVPSAPSVARAERILLDILLRFQPVAAAMAAGDVPSAIRDTALAAQLSERWAGVASRREGTVLWWIFLFRSLDNAMRIAAEEDKSIARDESLRLHTMNTDRLIRGVLFDCKVTWRFDHEDFRNVNSWVGENGADQYSFVAHAISRLQKRVAMSAR